MPGPDPVEMSRRRPKTPIRMYVNVKLIYYRLTAPVTQKSIRIHHIYNTSLDIGYECDTSLPTSVWKFGHLQILDYYCTSFLAYKTINFYSIFIHLVLIFHSKKALHLLAVDPKLPHINVTICTF